MKLLIRAYLASLKEREELDAILPDLLSELGYTVYSRPQRGTAQAGVDVAAVGKDDDGERKIFLFSIKQGDLTRQSWDSGTPQALRPSLNQILDNYIPNRIPKRFQSLKIVICLVFGGDMQEQVRSDVDGFIKRSSTERVSFDEWNGDKIAGLLLEGILREEIMPKGLRSHFQKAVAMVDEPDIAYQHFSRLAQELSQEKNNHKARIRAARQLYIAVWILFVWGRDASNVEAAYRASELLLLRIWDLLRPFIGKANAASRALSMVLQDAIGLHLTVASELLERKIFPHVSARDAISMAVQTRSSVDINLRLFDVLGRIGLTGIWVHWLIQRDKNHSRREANRLQVARFAALGYQLVANNPALLLPLQDQQAIEISLFLMFVGLIGGSREDGRIWLREMVGRLVLTIRTHGRYPCVFTGYRDLVMHPKEKSEAYLKEATSGSILIPLLAAFLSALNERKSMDALVALKESELKHCTLQLWMPDESSEEGFCAGSHDHGIALCDLPLSASGSELLETIQNACDESSDFRNLSAIRANYWPIILTACRHFRLPVPPQFWIDMVARPKSENPADTTTDAHCGKAPDPRVKPKG